MRIISADRVCDGHDVIPFSWRAYKVALLVAKTSFNLPSHQQAMNSNTGTAQTYEAGDQRTSKRDQSSNGQRFDEGQVNSHSDLDSKDQRSLANRLASASKGDKEDEERATITDPLAPARSHGNEPSRGAKIDAQIQAEEEEELRNKGKI